VITLHREKQNQGQKMSQKAAIDEAAIDVLKPKLEGFKGNNKGHPQHKNMVS
jgi:hypothetical protein